MDQCNLNFLEDVAVAQRSMELHRISAALRQMQQNPLSTLPEQPAPTGAFRQPPYGELSSCYRTAASGNLQSCRFSSNVSSYTPLTPISIQSPENLSLWLSALSMRETQRVSSGQPSRRQSRGSNQHERRKKGIASLVEARVKWMERGYQLLKKHYPNAVYSVKVFIGGLQYDTSAHTLEKIFKKFNSVRVLKSTREGHAYVIFANSECVSNLLYLCERLPSGEFFYLVANRKAQVIPWALQEIEWGERSEPEELSPTNVIFVGGLHGETTAEHLKIIMEDKFGEVQHVVIDTDKFKYPGGSARVQFVFQNSYLRAVEANFLEINTKHYSRSVQLEPFFEKNHQCSRCLLRPSAYLCRYHACLEYFCHLCFDLHRREAGNLYQLHKEVSLTTRNF